MINWLLQSVVEHQTNLLADIIAAECDPWLIIADNRDNATFDGERESKKIGQKEEKTSYREKLNLHESLDLEVPAAARCTVDDECSRAWLCYRDVWQDGNTWKNISEKRWWRVIGNSSIKIVLEFNKPRLLDD